MSFSRSIKKRAAYMVAGIALALLACGVGAFLYFSSRSSGIKADPDGDRSVKVGTGDGMWELPDIDWDYWRSVNPDVIAWIDIPGTSISLPICKAPASDPDYYLTHDVYRAYNPMGAVYMDASCPSITAAGNVVLFGHNWADTVFAEVAGYSDAAWASAHREVFIRMPDAEPVVLHVHAAEVIPGSRALKRTSFVDYDDLNEYWSDRFAASSMRFDDAPERIKGLYTLVTCSYNLWPDNERTLVYATRVSAPEGVQPPLPHD